jgi:3'-5' exoribonuclease
MKSPTVAELEPRQQINGLFLVQSKDVRQKKTGEPYLALTLIDRTGDIDAKMWDNVADILDAFERDDFIRVRGETQLYQNKLQLTIHRLARVDDSEVDLADFLPASKRDPEVMFAELQALIASLGNVHLRGLLENVFADAEVAQSFRRAPAAKAIHHNWLGGLMEHVLSLASLARDAARHYPFIDQDLLLAGVVLHDIGKIRELSYARSFNYTTEGSLIGHIQIALRMLADKYPPEFPDKLRNLLEHLILSHHGQLEFGSPKLPVFPEAMLLHHLDNMDSKMELMRSTIERHRPQGVEWTSYVPAIERYILDTDRYLNGVPEPPPATPPKPSGATKPGSKTVMADKLMSLFPEGGK